MKCENNLYRRMIIMTLGERIKQRRTELGLSQAELATLLNYGDRSTIAKIESGKNDITQSKIVLFADTLKTTPSYLMGWTDDPYDYDKDPDLRLSEIPSRMIESWRGLGLGNKQIWKAWKEYCANPSNSAAPTIVPVDSDFEESSTSRRIRLLARHLEMVPETTRERLLDNFENSIEMYFDAMGIPKEDK